MKDKIKTLVAQGSIEEALELAASFGSEFTSLQARLARLARNHRLGVISQADHSLEMNQITLALLDSLEHLPPPSLLKGEGSPTPKPARKLSVFFSYAREDLDLQKMLRKHLAALRRSEKISDWSDQEILAGSEWDEEIKRRLRAADIILLLVSPDFVDSDYIWKTELKVAMERHERREAVVVPIILRPCQWHGLPFGKLGALPAGGKAATDWGSLDQAFLSVAEGLGRLV